MSDHDADRPTQVHVVRGEPDDVELAALVAGLVAAGSGERDDAPAASRSTWNDRSWALRGPGRSPAPGADAWRWSLRG